MVIMFIIAGPLKSLRLPKILPPYTIFPFEDDVIADILMGKIVIFYKLNNNEIIRIIERAGWKLECSFLDIPQNEIQDSDIEDIELYRFRKG